MLKRYLYIAGMVVCLAACRGDHTTLFTLLSKSHTGIDFENAIQESDEMNVLNYVYFYNGAGVAVGDINNDGLQDILFTGNMVSNRLYLNKGNLKFEDITEKSGLSKFYGWCTGATMVDINGDGKEDIYICRSADGNPNKRSNLLFINQGDNTFHEEAEKYGLADRGYSTQAAFFDYDHDGDLDMFLINHSLQRYSFDVLDNSRLRQDRNPFFADKLYRNDGGVYKDVSQEAGITSNLLCFGLGIVVADINEDGWEDVYVSNDFNEPDYLFINNKDGTFSEKMRDYLDQISMYSMGCDIADYNNDGLPDIYTLDMRGEDNFTQKMHSGSENFDKMHHLFDRGFYYQFNRDMLHKNNGDGSFTELAQYAHVSNTNWSWGALFSDFDNDGRKDLVVSNGYVKDYTNMDFLLFTVNEAVKARRGQATANVRDYIAAMPTINVPNDIFQNVGNDRFVNKSDAWGLDKPGVSAGMAYVDLDNDGDMDLVINNVNDFASIYENNSEQLVKNNYLKVRLKGTPQNNNGIGAKVTVYCDSSLYYQEQSPVRGFQSSVDPILNFGIGKHQSIDSVVVVWPGRGSQKFTQVAPNEVLTANVNEATSGVYPVQVATPTYFDSSRSLVYRHEENPFNDFHVQPLLTNFLSREGPCMAKADVNGDGREDVFIGGAKGQPGSLFIQESDGRFVARSQRAFIADSSSEDVSAVFFDADGDGDLDLYVASGGYAYNDTSTLLRDRLYMNDGRGNFSKNERALPDVRISSSCVKAADIDQDGDLDLFVGGRLIPGKYPLPADSKILINNGKGTFSDETDRLAPALNHLGMVTDAVWVDVNKDKFPDLVVVGEWMPIHVYINEQGVLKDQSGQYIKFPSSGWWNTIMADDFDGDGDEDLILGNVGLNAQFGATTQKPLSLYYGDFDGNGSVDPIFCYFIGDTSYPAASKDDMIQGLPSLARQFPEYHRYARATIDDILTPDQLKTATQLHADLLSTVYLENNSSGFALKDLPREAQYAPVYAAVSLDVNHDGHKDFILAGNNSWTRISFGHLTASHGMLFLGDGKGNFTYVPQRMSGLRIRGDVRSMSVIPVGKTQEVIFGINDAETKVVSF
jgi:hypothetical protein